VRYFALIAVAAALALGVTSQVEAQTRPYSQVVDNTTKGRFMAADGWRASASGAQHYGKNFRLARPIKKSGVARFKVRIPTTKQYSVYARWPASKRHNIATPIGVRTTAGTKWTRVNQQRNGGKWVKIGTYRMERGDRYNVLVSRRGKGSRYVVADVVRIVEATRPSRNPDSILGAPIHDQASAKSYARSVGSSRYIMETIPLYYKLAPKVGIAPDVLVAQAILETGRGHYGGDSKPWNMAGIKKGGQVGDEPSDFERPATAYEGVRMHVNHMAAYTGKKTIGTPHDRFYDARSAQESRGWWVRRISQLGGGIWATDTTYDAKIRQILDDMARH
jgi:flagellum-specific peptidoglycan hydrolase FlgJ